ncbi:MAG TPA: DegT/DnrJ/EryC1/StrS family aminotransferase [Candidatus Hydrogenedentes bacterium]|nr:DegT/DnrJ/EryC1/StrS family aminotransferase [Candidatus Hydrogenedentota bacterium]HRK36343.1 DegT/DnrJ/EryC1/StrS family aminotransferase [Candidatus Hydrogenedentota bacterium]
MNSIRFDLESKFGAIYGADEERAIVDILRKNATTSGPECQAFEREFAADCGVAHARACSNGTAALFLALIGAGIKPGDRIITTPLTWIATAAAGVTLGATIDFVDIDPVTRNIDPGKIEAAINPKTRVILPVHLYGQPCDMDPILNLAGQYDLQVIEDAAHAPGALYHGRKAGSMGMAGCFSFHEQKNMSTLGEGGMITTNDPEAFERIALYRSHCTRVHGLSTKYCALDPALFPVGNRPWWQDFDDCGYNFRMTDMQAAVGRIQLQKLDKMNQRRVEIAARISAGLHGVPGLTLPTTIADTTHVYHLYPLRIDAAAFGIGKDDFIATMANVHGIKVGTHYIPLHWCTAFKNRGYVRGQFPVAEAVFESQVTLPIHPRLTDEAVDYLIDSVKACCASRF